MVYCGKPSRGCQTCRARRIKCDETKPICNQCQKSKRQCPGYKDDFDLVFRNETQATERRAQKSISRGRRTSTSILQNAQIIFSGTAQQDTKVSVKGSPTSPLDSESLVTLVPGALKFPIEQQAYCFFVQNFIHTPQDQTSRGWFDFVLPLIKTEGPESHLSVAFSAVAMASLANRPNTKGRGPMPQAIGLYTMALKQLNLALQNPALQKQDSTVASILLLGFFETITSERSNVMAWGSHIDGAVQLIKLRGKKQLRTKTGYALFITVRAQMLIHCMSASRPPILGVDWWMIESPGDHSGVIDRLLLRVAQLRAEVNHYVGSYPRTPDHIQKVLDLMRRAQDMEQEAQDWTNLVQDPWRVKTAAWVENIPGGDIMKADVCPGKVDTYRDIFIASMWNHARIARLFLTGLIVRLAAWVCSPVNYRTTPEYATSARVGADMVTDIIASVPFLLGWRVDGDGQLRAADLSSLTLGNADITSVKGLGGFFLTWPLFCAICSDYATDLQRQWIKGRMNHISDVMGMNQARTLGSFQIRLPSMIIYRDNMSSTYPSFQGTAKIATESGPASVKTPPQVPIKTEPTTPEPRFTAPSPSGNAAYASNPIQQHSAMQRKAFEVERKMLLKKASNSAGESAERSIGDYFAI